MQLLTGGGGATVQRRQQWAEQVLLSEAGPLLNYRERRPGGHTLELQGCHLVFEVQQVENLKNKKNAPKFEYNLCFRILFFTCPATMLVIVLSI